VQDPVTATITDGPCDTAVLCPDVPLTLLLNPSTTYMTTHWVWQVNGTDINSTNDHFSYDANTPGNYNVFVTDPVCGDVNSNIIPVVPWIAVLGGPPCVCFGNVYDLFIKTNDCQDHSYSVHIFKPGTICFTGSVMSSNGIIIIPNITINKDDIFSGSVQGPCGTIQLNNYQPAGCDNCQ
jgi:hypothetical protein